MSVALVASILGLVGTAQDASAATRPTCTNLGRVTTGTHAWLDDRGRGNFVRNLDRLICSAADYSTIDIKSWFIKVDGPEMRTLAAHLSLMHRYHHVRVHTMIGRSWYTRSGQWSAYRHFVAVWRPFSSIGICNDACQSTVPNASSHSKWVTVSRLRWGGTAVLSTSSNFTHQQLVQTRQSGMFIVRNPTIYNAFVARFNAYGACAMSQWSARCAVRTPQSLRPVHWYRAHGTAAYFTALAGDPAADVLSRVRCTGHRFVQISSLYFHRVAVRDQLQRLRAQGCTVRVLVEHAPLPDFHHLDTRCMVIHDKTLLVDANVREVLSGAEDFVVMSVHGSDNQSVLTGSPSTVAAYKSFYLSLWSRARRC